jgi:TonB-linked SusC/RagA family outer membrane protein
MKKNKSKISLKLRLMLLSKLFLIGILLFSQLIVFAQQKSISGKVVGDDNAPIPGVTVIVKGTSVGTVTGNDGNFELNVPVSAKTLIVSYIGMKSQEVEIGNKTTFNIQLKPDVVGLDEVVVIGYGTQKRRDITGAVSSIGSQEINDYPVTNVSEALVGKIAGLDVIETGPNPGDGAQIRLRGRRSFTASNDPLFILDGMPFYGSLNDINPYDIESIDVLKDASSTAIYGSRGANGVIIITTKRGKLGKPKFNFEAFAGPQIMYGNIPFGNGDQYAERGRASLRYSGQYKDANGNIVYETSQELDKKFFQPEEYDNLYVNNTWHNYQDMLFQNAFEQKYQLSVDGGTDAVKYNIAGNYYKEEGILPGRTFDRFTVRSNLDIDLSPKFKVGTSILLGYNLRHWDSSDGAVNEAQQGSPLGKPYNEDGSANFKPTADGIRSHPLADYEFDSYTRDMKRWSGYVSAFGEYQILPSLSYRLNLGVDVNVNTDKEFQGYYSIARNQGTPLARNNHQVYSRNLYESIITWDQTFGDHKVTLTGVQGLQSQHAETADINVSGIPYEPARYHNVGAATTINSVASNLIEWTLVSYVGRLFYSYKGKYLLTASIRADGASQFAPNHKWGYFPSAALAWRISDENFLKESTWISNLKLRLSYGVTGNQAINPYQTQGGLAPTIYAWDETGAFGYRPAELANKDLKWESTAVKNIGLDFGFLEGRINGNIEFYDTDTYDLLMQRQLPSNTGYLSVIENIGNTRNRGFELGLNTLNMDKGNFKWSSDFLFYLNREEIVELYNGKVDDVGNRWFIGYPIHVYYDFKKIGIWQTEEATAASGYARKPGEIKLLDINEDGKYTDADRSVVGTREPDFVTSLTNRFNYKNWDMSFIFYCRWGNTVYASPFNPHSQKRYNQLVQNYWTPQNPTNDYPSPNENREGTLDGSTLGYLDGSYIRLRQLSFGYNFPKAMLQKTNFINNARIYLTGENLWYWTKSPLRDFNIDPEDPDDIGTPYPAMRTFIVGVNISF